MIRLILSLALVALAAPDWAFAANQQVNRDTWRKNSAQPPFSQRDDGIVWHKTTKVPRFVGNGDGFTAIGATWYEDFSAYADGQGAFCEAVTIPGDTGFTLLSGGDTACDTTCGQLACTIGLHTSGAADGAVFVACDGATADSCLCQNTGLDLYGVCGANWEAGALGVTLVTLPTGNAVATVALVEEVIGVDMDADGLDISGDEVNDNGHELVWGLYGASGRPMWPGLDPAFKFCATIGIEDLSGTDEFWVGWRDITAPNATFNNYNSYAVVGVDNTTGDIHVETEDDGGGTTTTDISVSAWPEGQANGVEFCSMVSDTGVVTHSVAGETDATNEPAYTLDNGEPVVPFIHFLNSADVAGEIILSEAYVTYQ